MKIVARILSAVFIPLLMPVYALMMVMYLPQDLDLTTFQDSLFILTPKAKNYFLMIFTTISFVFPAISILVMRWTKLIDTIEMDHRRERFLPYIIIAVYGAGLTLLLYKVNTVSDVSRHLLALALGCTVISIVNLFINIKMKVSAHATGVGILLGFLFSYYINQPLIQMGYLWGAIAVGAAVISSRIVLQKHTDKELLVGFSVGFTLLVVLDLLFVNRII